MRDFSSASARAVSSNLPDLVGRRAARLLAHLVVELRLGLGHRQPGDLLQPRARLHRLRRRRARRRLGRRLAPRQLLLAARRLLQPLLELALLPLELALALAGLARLLLQLRLARLQLGVDLRPRLLGQLLGVQRRLPLERLGLDLGRRDQPPLLLLGVRQPRRAHRPPDEERDHQNDDQQRDSDRQRDHRFPSPRSARAGRSTRASVTTRSTGTSPSPAGQRATIWKS